MEITILGLLLVNLGLAACVGLLLVRMHFRIEKQRGGLK